MSDLGELLADSRFWINYRTTLEQMGGERKKLRANIRSTIPLSGGSSSKRSTRFSRAERTVSERCVA